MILLLQECWGHGKVFIKYNKYNSPSGNILQNEGFKVSAINYNKKYINEELQSKPGLDIIFLITDIKNLNNVIIDYLLNTEYIEKQELLNMKLWVGENFKKLRQLILEKYSKHYKIEIQGLLHKDVNDDIYIKNF